jgi:hypothetical protein
MEKYKIIDTIMLSFILDNEQRDLLFSDGTLEREGHTVWYITSEGERYESITTANIIEVGLKRKSIEEI